MAKKTATAIETERMDEEAGPALPVLPEGGKVVSGPMPVLDKGTIDRSLGDLFDFEHAGGSLPLIAWTRPGQSVVAKYLGIDAALGDREFDLVVLDVIDVVRLRETRNPEASIAGRAQIVGSTAIMPYFMKATPGVMVRITYHGDIATKRGQSNMKLLTIEELKIKPAGK